MPDATTPHRTLLERAAQMFGVRVADIFAPTHKDDIIHARFAVCLVLARSGVSPQAIGDLLCRQRLAVTNAIARAYLLAVHNPEFRHKVENLYAMEYMS